MYNVSLVLLTAKQKVVCVCFEALSFNSFSTFSELCQKGCNVFCWLRCQLLGVGCVVVDKEVINGCYAAKV